MSAACLTGTPLLVQDVENVIVEDVGRFGARAVEQLRQALAQGAPFTADPKRKRFYEVRLDDERFYIHVLASGRKVLLLLRWTAPAGAA